MDAPQPRPHMLWGTPGAPAWPGITQGTTGTATRFMSRAKAGTGSSPGARSLGFGASWKPAAATMQLPTAGASVHSPRLGAPVPQRPARPSAGAAATAHSATPSSTCPSPCAFEEPGLAEKTCPSDARSPHRPCAQHCCRRRGSRWARTPTATHTASGGRWTSGGQALLSGHC